MRGRLHWSVGSELKWTFLCRDGFKRRQLAWFGPASRIEAAVWVVVLVSVVGAELFDAWSSFVFTAPIFVVTSRVSSGQLGLDRWDRGLVIISDSVYSREGQLIIINNHVWGR